MRQADAKAMLSTHDEKEKSLKAHGRASGKVDFLEAQYTVSRSNDRVDDDAREEEEEEEEEEDDEEEEEEEEQEKHDHHQQHFAKNLANEKLSKAAEAAGANTIQNENNGKNSFQSSLGVNDRDEEVKLLQQKIRNLDIKVDEVQRKNQLKERL